MAVTKQQKEKTLKWLLDSFKNAKAVVFSQYQGTNVKDMRLLRKNLLAKKVNFKVAKKTLVNLAAKQCGLEQIPDELMAGPVGLGFAMEDAVWATKIIYDFGKEHDTVKITGAFFEGKFIGAQEAKDIAMLPGREVLLARLVSSLKSPVYGFYGILHGILRNFVYAVSEVAKKKTPA